MMPHTFEVDPPLFNSLANTIEERIKIGTP
jgi:hypothetical protein